MLAAYLRGIQRFDLFNAAATGTVVLRALLFLAALRRGAGVVTIALITLGMGAVSFGAHYGMIRWSDRDLRIRLASLNRKRLWELFGFSIYAFIASLGTRLITRIDSIVIGRILSVALIAPFNVASRLTDYFVGVFAGVHGPVLSAMSELDGASRREELRALFLRSSRYTFLLSSVIGSLFVADGRELLKLWLGSSGLDIDLTYRVLVILTVCYTANQAQLPSWSVIYARAQHRLLAWLTLFEGLVNLGLSIYWGHRYGLVGIALGTTVPAVIHHLLIVPYYALRVIEMPVTRYLEGLWRPLVVGGAFIGLSWFDWGSSASILVLALRMLCRALLFGLIAYTVASSQDEKRFLWTRCRGFISVRWVGK
jgi:O-antigen/teichoic acid export membrane protein